MIRYIAALTLALLLTNGAALSAQATDNSPAPAKTQTIKISKAFALRNALTLATGLHDEAVGQGASQSIAKVLYNIDPSARWALNDDLAILNALLEPVEKTINDLQRQLVGENGGVPIPAKADNRSRDQEALLQRFNDESDKILQSEKEINTLFHIRRGDLKEPLPGEVVAPMQAAGIIDP